MIRAIVIPAEGPLQEIVLRREDGSHLKHLQELVGGLIQPVDVPVAFDRSGRSTMYVNEEGKFTEPANMRATDWIVPGVGIFFGDYIAGTAVLVGFDPDSGAHLPELPRSVVDRARLIASESGAGMIHGWETAGMPAGGGGS